MKTNILKAALFATFVFVLGIGSTAIASSKDIADAGVSPLAEKSWELFMTSAGGTVEGDITGETAVAGHLVGKSWELFMTSSGGAVASKDSAEAERAWAMFMGGTDLWHASI